MNIQRNLKLTVLTLALGLLASLFLGACSPATNVEAAPQPTNMFTIERPTLAVSTNTPIPNGPVFHTYSTDEYRLSFNYPEDWTLLETVAGEGNPVWRVVELTRDGYHVLLHIKFTWDQTVIGGALSPGEMQSKGNITLLEQTITLHALVDGGRTKLIWYGGKFDDLELYIRLEVQQPADYGSVNLPAEIIAEVEDMLSSMKRTGAPVASPTPENSSPPEPDLIPCALAPHLKVNGWAQVTPGLPNTLRSGPAHFDSQLGKIPAGTVIHVLEGPICANSYNWWKVKTEALTGWTPEGGDGVYWLQPAAGEAIVVEGWVGVVVSNPTGTQFDDYFQMLDQDGTRYGIDSLDESLRQHLIDLRDTGQMIRVWGTLEKNVPDAYVAQIVVTRMEIE